MRLGQILRKWRILADLTMAQVAEQIGIGTSTLVHIEQGKVPDGKTLLKLMAWLFGEEIANGGSVQSPAQSNERVSDVARVDSHQAVPER